VTSHARTAAGHTPAHSWRFSPDYDVRSSRTGGLLIYGTDPKTIDYIEVYIGHSVTGERAARAMNAESALLSACEAALNLCASIRAHAGSLSGPEQGIEEQIIAALSLTLPPHGAT
jgi:hypothetical protein